MFIVLLPVQDEQSMSEFNPKENSLVTIHLKQNTTDTRYSWERSQQNCNKLLRVTVDITKSLLVTSYFPKPTVTNE